MDTKLKNRCNIKYMVIAGVIFLAAVIMVGLYPYFGKKAEQSGYQRHVYEEEYFHTMLANSCYVLYREMINREGDVPLSPGELYLPGIFGGASPAIPPGAVIEDGADGFTITYQDEAAFSRGDVQDRLYEMYRMWEENWNDERKNIDYQVIDHESGQVVLGNQEGMMQDQEYMFFVEISYDEKGGVSISRIKGTSDNIQLQSSLTESVHKNPMEDYYDSELMYNSLYSFEKPENVSFVYGMTKEQVTFGREMGSYWEEIPYYRAGDVMKMLCILSAVIFGLAFFIPVADKSVTGKEWYSRGFLEAALFVGVYTLGNPYHVSMISDINRGVWQYNLEQAGFFPYVSKILVVAGSMVWWLAIFFLVFWVSSCVLSIRTLGTKRYFKERCLCYRLLLSLVGTIKKLVGKIYKMVAYMDKNDESKKTIFKLVLINFLVLAAICSAWFFGLTLLVIYSVVLYVILAKYFRDRRYQYKILLKATNQIAEGNLDVEIKEELGMFEPFKVEIQKIQQGFKKAVDEEVKSQRMKTDLISNVSHDLKTPLTAIITYVNLLKEESTTEEQRRGYIEILDSKSMRLKALIEDIFEISKATSQNVTLNLMEIDIVSLLKQVRLELEDKIEESNLDFRWKLPDTKILLMLDSQKTYRIFENLLLNILKYALSGTRVYIEMGVHGEEVIVSMKNVSAVELYGNPNDMTERFARGDQARNTDGSGLGLAIVKSFVELQKGKLDLEAEADLFKVTIRWGLNS